jgi:hypothetical protein
VAKAKPSITAWSEGRSPLQGYGEPAADGQ